MPIAYPRFLCPERIHQLFQVFRQCGQFLRTEIRLVALFAVSSEVLCAFYTFWAISPRVMDIHSAAAATMLVLVADYASTFSLIRCSTRWLFGNL